MKAKRGERMNNVFLSNRLHTVTDANVNFYKAPCIHPSRRMREHDFIYLLKGEWELGQNGKTYKLTEDSLLILFAGQEHYGVSPCKAGTKTMYFHATCEDGDLFDASGAHPPCIRTLTDAKGSPGIRELFSEVVTHKLSGAERKAALYLELLLLELAAPKMCFKEKEIAADIQSMIHRYPEKFFTNEALAQAVNVSTKTAETKFKAAFGKTIHQYVLDFKIKEACSYFERFEGIAVKEVAYNLGFCDEYHFSKQFSKLTGMSPKRYKAEVERARRIKEDAE